MAEKAMKYMAKKSSDMSLVSIIQENPSIAQRLKEVAKR
jgi:hypothetical protein